MTKETDYKLVIGLEVHMHVKTAEGMFCGCSSNIYGAEPNTHTCPVCLGLPGALPVPNEESIKKTQMLGLVLNCELNNESHFDRKHYFYPDLPKGYQISQYKKPLCEGGYLTLSDGFKVKLERIHLEEDTAKSFHKDGKTLIDFNKSGTSLIELVTKPMITSAEQAASFAKKLRDIVVYMGISDADMEKGQMRIEPNISVRTKEMEEKGELPNYKVEVKNINSFRYMVKAVNYEFERQVELFRNGELPSQENRGWDEKKNITVAQRSKENSPDYRYFPEPDIPPMRFDDAYFNQLKSSLPKTPDEIAEELRTSYGLSQNLAEQLTSYPGLNYINTFYNFVKQHNPEKVAKLLLNKPEYRDMSYEDFTKSIAASEEKIGDEDVLSQIVDAVIAENEDIVASYKNGKTNALNFLVGQVMRHTQGKADAQSVEKLFLSKFKS